MIVVAQDLGEDACKRAQALASDLRRDGARLAGLWLVGPLAGAAPPGSDDEALHLLPAAPDSLVDAVNSLFRAEPGEPCDIVLLEDGVALDGATLDELRRVASLDPMIAFVGPRFDRDSPHAFPRRPRPAGAGEDPAAAVALLRRHLPALRYVPVPDHRCVYVKGEILDQFGGLRTEAGALGAALGDLALRLNRYGFGAALANHVLLRRPAAGARDDPGPGALERLHPAYARYRARFLASSETRAEHVIAGLLPGASGCPDVAFDFSDFERHHAGTVTLACELVRRAAEAWSDKYNVHVICRPDVYDFHLGRLSPGIPRTDPGDPRSFAALIRVGQPFSWTQIEGAVVRAPALIVFMLDTIALDCMAIASDDLESLWRFTLRSVDAVLFNSRFTQRQFGLRFEIPDQVLQCPSLHAVDPDEYRPAAPASDEVSGGLLVVGNAFPHKFVAETVEALARALPDETILALGLTRSTLPNLVAHPSGNLTQDEIERLYGQARLVIYPSLYEGFGFPLLEALARRKPVLARPLPPFREIAAETGDAQNIHFYESEAELLRLVQAGIGWTDAPRPARPRGWHESCSDLERAVDEAIGRASYARVVDRLDRLKGQLPLSRRQASYFGEAGSAEPGRGRDLDRAASRAGHLAQVAVYRLGTSVGGLALARFLWTLVRRRRG